MTIWNGPQIVCFSTHVSMWDSIYIEKQNKYTHLRKQLGPEDICFVFSNKDNIIWWKTFYLNKNGVHLIKNTLPLTSLW